MKLAKKKYAKKLSNTLRLNFRYLKIIHFLHLCYHPKTIGDIFKNVQKISICFNDVIELLVMTNIQHK